jgi:hypothetical protein
MKRIQRKRVKGWKMPPNTIYVGRPTKWGNNFAGTKEGLEQYREHIVGNGKFMRSFNLEELRGKNLACWCPLDKPCHADILLELANK